MEAKEKMESQVLESGSGCNRHRSVFGILLGFFLVCVCLCFTNVWIIRICLFKFGDICCLTWCMLICSRWLPGDCRWRELL